MITTVVNLYKEPYDIYIGRQGKGKDGYFGNTHIIGFCKVCNKSHSREESVEAFRIDFHKRVEADGIFKEKLKELKGKRLGCFCKPQVCHGDVFVEYLEK
jgi:hypothetical protein